MSAVNVTDETLDAVLEVRASLVKTGCDHRIFIEAPGEWDSRQDGLYVTGHRYAGLDRCAHVSTNGEITWIR